ncbi:unnamed protein product [Tilletia controversa]|nr:hypothetical protein CF336_g3607 [Tilletia laevis]CAD6934674.1 unnamed protein product [Tilletia controversa]
MEDVEDVPDVCAEGGGEEGELDPMHRLQHAALACTSPSRFTNRDSRTDVVRHRVQKAIASTTFVSKARVASINNVEVDSEHGHGGR